MDKRMKKIRMVYEKYVAISEQEQEEQEPDPEPTQQEIGVLDPDCPMDQFNYDEMEFCSVADSSDKSWWHYYTHGVSAPTHHRDGAYAMMKIKHEDYVTYVCTKYGEEHCTEVGEFIHISILE